MPASAEGGAGASREALFGSGPKGGADNPTGPGGPGAGERFGSSGGGGGGGGAGYPGGPGGEDRSRGGVGGTHGGVDSFIDPRGGSTIGGFAGTNGGEGGRGSYSGGGGAGGYGAVVTGTGRLSITGPVTGGNGGSGGKASGQSDVAVGSGGSGGIGVLFTNPDGATVDIRAAVRGGEGGSPGHPETEVRSYHPGRPGVGGVGISGQNLHITMSEGGSVTGGGGKDAITFTGGVNSLSITNLTAITGRVSAFSRDDRLLLSDGPGAGPIDVVALSQQYVNFHVVNNRALSVNAGQGWGIANRLTNNGTLTVNGTLQGLVTNAGTFNNNASGTLHGRLTNTAGMTTNAGVINGEVVISGGTVALVGAGRIDVRPLAIQRIGTLVSIDAGSGRIDLSNAASTFDISRTDAGATIQRLDGVAFSHVELGSQTLTIDHRITVADDINRSDYSGLLNANFAGIIQGRGGLTLVSGRQELSGFSTYTGATNINGGTLVVNGSIASSPVVTVNPGGTLTGNGSFGNVTNNGGTFSPGNSIGTFRINGDLTMRPNSRYYVELNGDTSDLIVVSGRANIQSSIFEIARDTNRASAPVLPGKTYTVITTGGGVTGNAPAVAIADFPFLFFRAWDDGLNGYLTTARSTTAFADLATTRNEKAVAGALDTVAAGNPLWQQAVGSSEAQARAGFTSLGNAAIHASAQTALVEESWLLRSAANDRLRSALGAVGAAPMATMSYGFTADLAPTTTGPMPALRSDRFAVWGQGYGAWGRGGGDGNAARLSRSTGGLMVGADLAVFDNLRFGALAGYSRSTFDAKGTSASGESDNYHLGLYGGGQWGALALRSGASYTWHAIETSRSVAFANFSDRLRADYNAGTAQIFGELGYRIDLGRVAFEPFVGLAYVNLHTDGLREVGGAAALSARGDDTNVGYATLGLRAATSLDLNGMALTLRGGLAWRHAFGDVDPARTLAFAGGSSPFTITGLPIARNAALVEAGLDLAIGPSATLGLSYNGQLAADAQDHSFKGVLAVRF